MAAPSTPLDLVNLGLLQLFQDPISSLEDTNEKAARIGNILYDQTRRSIQSNFDWNFCRQRSFAPLLPLVKPAFDWQFAYQMPDDLLTLNFVGYDWERYVPCRHEIQGRMIFANEQPCNAWAGVGGNIGFVTMLASSITQANPGVVTVPSTQGIQDGQAILISGVEGMTQLNGNGYTMLSVGATFFTLGDQYAIPLDTSTFSDYISGGTIVTVGPVAGQPTAPSPAIPIIYRQDTPLVTQFSPLFIDVLSLQLAVGMCMPMTGDQNLLQRLELKLKSQLAEASAINHMERPVIVTERFPGMDARYVLSDSTDGMFGAGQQGNWGRWTDGQ